MTALSKEESYAERRQLFKSIWKTAMQIDKESEASNKPKVIKTARLEDSVTEVNKRKKQRLRNLRTVCNKMLEFCNRQDAADAFYEMAGEDGLAMDVIKWKKLKNNQRKRKIKVSKKPNGDSQTAVKPTTLAKKTEEFDAKLNNLIAGHDTGQETASKLKPALTTTALVTSVRQMPVPNSMAANMLPRTSGGIHKKTVRKKINKRKKTLDSNSVYPSAGTSRNSRMQNARNAALKGSMVIRRIRQVLTDMNIKEFKKTKAVQHQGG